MLQIHVLQGWELIEDLEKLPQRLKAASYEFQRGDAVAVWKKGTVGLETVKTASRRRGHLTDTFGIVVCARQQQGFDPGQRS